MESSQESAPQLAWADPLANKEVLALAALAWSEEERAATWRMIRDAAQSDPATVALLAARQDGHLIGAALAHIVPGRAAVVWPPQFATQGAAAGSVGTKILSLLSAELGQRGALAAQVILPCKDAVQAARLQTSGFWRAADLLYLAAEAACFPTDPPELPFQLESFQDHQTQRLIELIDRTYAGTLDCPRIDGMRSTADVVAGHRAVGDFRPERWQFARLDGHDIGCLLVNVHGEIKHAELVYLGLVSEVRGRGFGRLLSQRALWLARQSQCDRLVLAVDAANAPAIAAYRAVGLSIWDRKALWVRSLTLDASSVNA